MRTTAQPAERQPSQPADHSRPRARNVLLASGVVASALYLATDVLGGLRYPGYSFWSQAISELMAVGAPSERLVDPMFIAYDVLMVLFGVGVLLTSATRAHEISGSATRRQATRVVGVLLFIYGVVGFTGPTLFEMQPRGTPGSTSDVLHIVVTVVVVLLLLLSIGFGAFALGRRFRVYSFAMLLMVIVFGALSAPYGARLGAGQPTPGFGVVERVNVYASLLWIAVFAVALMRRRDRAGGRPQPHAAG